MSDYLDSLVTRTLGTALVVQPRPVARFEPAAAIGVPLAAADFAMEQINTEPAARQELGRPAPPHPPALSARPLQPAPSWLAAAPRHPLEPPWRDPRGQHAVPPEPPAERASQPESDTPARRELRTAGPPLAPPPTAQPPLIRVERTPDQPTPPTADLIRPAIVQSPEPMEGPLHTMERIIERVSAREPPAQAAAPTPLLPT